MSWPQIILIVWLILGVIIVPANDETYWKIRNSLGVRLIRTAMLVALLWWGGFWN